MCVDQIVSFRLPKINKIFKNTKIFRKNIQYISLLSKLIITKKSAEFDDFKLRALVFCENKCDQ